MSAVTQDPQTSRPSEGAVRLALRFDSGAAFRSEFARSLADGAAFVATKSPIQRDQPVELEIDLVFCGEVVELPAVVVAVIDEDLAEIGEQSTPGVSLRLMESAEAVRGRLEAAVGHPLTGEKDADPNGDRRTRTRRPSNADIILQVEGVEHAGVTANLSYTGVLAMLSTGIIPVGSQVRVELSKPLVELGLSIDGRVVHSRHCDGGLVAHGIQLHYPAARIDEVMAFIEFLQSFDRARRLAVVSGAIGADGLAPILDLFVNTAPAGTLVVTSGEEQGRIVFSENYLLRCTAGMASGTKALSRLFLWTDGRFEFHHDLQHSDQPDEPVAIETAMMMASVQLDEIRRSGVDTFAGDEAFERAEPPVAIEPAALSDLERKVCEHAAQGFSVDMIRDMVPEPDADILKALIVLLDLGLIRNTGSRPSA